ILAKVGSEMEGMIRMDQYGYIRTAYRVYQKSIKQICRETGHSRETVRKVLRSEPFGYAPRVEQPYPVMGSYLQTIDQWLAEDKDRPKKQRHTAKRIYDRLFRELGFKGSDSTVRHYVRKAKMRLGVQVTPTFPPWSRSGGVEGLVGYVRRNYLVPMPVAESFEDLHDKLLEECLAYGDHRIKGREGTVNELFAGEQSHLLSLPEMPFTVIQTTTGKVDAYGTVIVDKNRYSVPTRYTGLKVKVHLAVACLEIFHNGKKLVTHPRLFGNNKWQLNPDHYLELIQQRPGAFHSARPLRRWRETWPASLEKLLARFQESQGETAGIKDFISVLMLYREYSGQEIEAAAELALAHHLSSSPGVKHLLQTKSEPGHAPLQQWPATLIPDVSVYGQLGGVS
ncbi:MAG TPA: hypothetical protein VIN67_08470, partial [Desulfobaccales bacterium]